VGVGFAVAADDGIAEGTAGVTGAWVGEETAGAWVGVITMVEAVGVALGAQLEIGKLARTIKPNIQHGAFDFCIGSSPRADSQALIDRHLPV